MSPQALEEKFPHLVKSVENIQNDCHAFAHELMKMNSELSYQDAANVYLYYRIAALETRMKAHDNGNPFYN